MDFEVLVRYTLPGTLFIFPFVIWGLWGDANPSLVAGIDNGLGFLLATLTIPVGYLIQQIWFTLFEAFGGYVTLKRRNLNYLAQVYKAAGKAKSKNLNEYTKSAYFAWESWIYGNNVPEGHRNRARRLWQLFHGLASSALASLSAILITFLLPQTLSENSILLIASINGILCGGFIFRAIKIYRDVSEWELMMAIVDTRNTEENNDPIHLGELIHEFELALDETDR